MEISFFPSLAFLFLSFPLLSANFLLRIPLLSEARVNLRLLNTILKTQPFSVQTSLRANTGSTWLMWLSWGKPHWGNNNVFVPLFNRILLMWGSHHILCSKMEYAQSLCINFYGSISLQRPSGQEGREIQLSLSSGSFKMSALWGCPWLMLPPESLLMSMAGGPAGGHVDVHGPHYHPVSWWCMWSVLPPTAKLVTTAGPVLPSRVCCGQGHVDGHSLC